MSNNSEVREEKGKKDLSSFPPFVPSPSNSEEAS